MFHSPARPATSTPGRVLTTPFSPASPLWEQWYDHYTRFTHDELTDEEERLVADSDRMSRMCIPDTEALCMVGMRLSLIEDLLAAAR
jgi:hypothetical protein